MKLSFGNSLRDILAMVGAIIGAGVFAVPIAFKDSGILMGSLIYWAIAGVVLVTHLIYAEVMVSDKRLMADRLPGQASRILGSWAGRVASVSHPLQILGACFAYVILGGDFLAALASAFGLPTSTFFWQLAFWAGGAVTVFVGLAFVARVEVAMTAAFSLLLLVCSFFFMRGVSSQVISWDQISWMRAVAPVGIFLFALFGLTFIPELVFLSKRDPARIRRTIIWGSLISAFLIWIFGISSYLALGTDLYTPADLVRGLPSSLFWLIPAVGFLAVSSAFITMMEDLTSMLHIDFHLVPSMAWGLSLIGPLILLFILDRDVVRTVGFVGSVFSGLNGLLVGCMGLVLWKRTARQSLWGVFASLGVMLVFCVVLLWGILQGSL